MDTTRESEQKATCAKCQRQATGNFFTFFYGRLTSVETVSGGSIKVTTWRYDKIGSDRAFICHNCSAREFKFGLVIPAYVMLIAGLLILTLLLSPLLGLHPVLSLVQTRLRFVLLLAALHFAFAYGAFRVGDWMDGLPEGFGSFIPFITTVMITAWGLFWWPFRVLAEIASPPTSQFPFSSLELKLLVAGYTASLVSVAGALLYLYLRRLDVWPMSRKLYLEKKAASLNKKRLKKIYGRKLKLWHSKAFGKLKSASA
jgi:hypothetical protein